MSNLVTNGDLFYPTLNSNTSLSGINMGTTQITGWTNPTNSSSLTLCNGVISRLSGASIPVCLFSRYCSLYPANY